MGKGRRHNRNPSSSVTSTDSASTARAKVEAADAAAASLSETVRNGSGSKSSLLDFLSTERRGISWVAGCALVGAFLGFGIGTGHLTGAASTPVSPWRKALGSKIRSSSTFRILTFRTKPWTPVLDLFDASSSTTNPISDPSNSKTYELLVEAIERENGGYVHPDLGMLIPAPSGAARGIGMVHDVYDRCDTTVGCSLDNQTSYVQEEVLIRVPLSCQMTRSTALKTLLPLLPSEQQQSDHFKDLDDAALLVLLLAHERGLSHDSRWMPYIASLPIEPSCGYSFELRPYMLDAIAAYASELGLDVNGWARELSKAGKYADKIASSLARDYGSYIKSPDGVPVYNNLQWALCQVASRAAAGSDEHGSLRLVPIMDMINHDANAGGFVELTGRERIEKGDFINATEADSGMFVVRSLRHGRRKPLRKGQELMVNYNVPAYSPLDWLISLGFVPPERWHQWQKVDSALPRVRKDGTPFSANNIHSSSRHAGSEL